ncbi:Uncharacterized conserved protein YgiB, involved in bioifilm formation, UPF0441/DUF1190 family [Pseudomonas cuatrocienegasensis]|uniref:Uncharacterized conserved protein YgiB, involved in bioifilm formation, UPF0441/DUF1190 family n=1 Tax=Pseudomonas cuatrocienegasensis TaxID=543360 RepID=A0ABY1BRJ8_9PSED|nr:MULTISPECIES: DUF1190 domain-containing protein [Pseudomonas]OEC32608.1 hypothetical protein A7D25_23170 [Pseudomonas sp. 21C1]SER46397.1 Uncharacterized conserved protein YgiB, involved in bioifilm formation, UPF0441/DUF1190 family [Pseudomonas cuatrocienegasensis]
MKRSKCVQLSLSAAVTLAVTGCQAPEKQYQINKTFNFDSVQQCVDQKIPVDVCSDAFMTAIAEHRRIAPTYASRAECDSDFVENYCKVDSRGMYTPPMGGFQLSAEGQVSESQLAQSQATSGTGTSAGSGLNNVVMGMLIGNMLSSSGGRYYSEPVYRYREDRGDYYGTSTLATRIRSGTTFKNSTQAKSGSGYSSIITKPIAVKSTTSRGGFGSQASARSGWGSSFGG